jgi:hypothetical protein
MFDELNDKTLKIDKYNHNPKYKLLADYTNENNILHKIK